MRWRKSNINQSPPVKRLNHLWCGFTASHWSFPTNHTRQIRLVAEDPQHTPPSSHNYLNKVQSIDNRCIHHLNHTVFCVKA
jgi:hypothetical protein